jgi:SAM-dependent methyltransferase
LITFLLDFLNSLLYKINEMNKLTVKGILIITFFFLNLLSCKSPAKKESMQPYEGYPLIGNIDTIKQTLAGRCLDTIRFIKGETIADIGAGNGYLEGMLSVFNDSLTFYIQDIDTSVCNQRAVDRVVDFYKKIIIRPFTCRFFVVNGSDIESNLPDKTFDKILILYTYQYFKYPKIFITDLKQKLKPHGRLYLVNPDVDHESSDSLKAVNGWNASPIEEEINDMLLCGFELISISRNYKDVDNTPYIMVFKLKNQEI